MTPTVFVETYLKPKLKLNTWRTKDVIFQKKLIPYFKDKKMNEISPADIIKWQNEMIKKRQADGKPYKPTYLKTMQSELSAIFNHAVRFYNLRENPVKKAGTIGKGKADEMDFWTKEEYLKFIECVKDKPISYYAFQILYWCGIREGELLALTPADINFKNKKLHITKSYQYINGEDIITDPKTEKSRRDVVIPDFLVEELRQFIGMLYGYGRDDRIFQITKSYLHHEMSRELEAKGYFTMRGKCPRKYFEQKIYGYEDYYNPDYEPQRNRSKVVEEMDYEAAVGDSVISEQDEVDIPPETNELSEDGAEIAENVMLDADVMVKETTE